MKTSIVIFVMLVVFCESALIFRDSVIHPVVATELTIASVNGGVVENSARRLYSDTAPARAIVILVYLASFYSLFLRENNKTKTRKNHEAKSRR